VRKTLSHVFTEYGAVALILYLTIFFLVFAGVWLALQAGWSPTSTTGKAGGVAAAYIITKLTQPLRIGATVLLTPLLAKVYERIRFGRRPPEITE